MVGIRGMAVRPAPATAALRARRHCSIRRLPLLLLLGFGGAVGAFGWRPRPITSPAGGPVVLSWRANCGDRGRIAPAGFIARYQPQRAWTWGPVRLLHAAADGAEGDDGAPTTTTTTTAFTVESGGWPMDIVLARQFPQLSRRACRRLLQEGHVRVDGKVMRRFGKVGKGAAVQVTIPQAPTTTSSGGGDDEKGPAVGAGASLLGLEIRPEPMDLTVLHEDEWLIAVSKGPGVVVQPCESAATGTLLHGVVHHWTESGEEVPILASPTQAIVHRLDKDTSGVLLLAKTLPSARRLGALFKTRAVRKTYLALCHGDPCAAAAKGSASKNDEEAGVVVMVDQPIFRKANGKMAVPTTEEERAKARRAVSRVETIATDGGISLVRVQILTGRTHQIRVHLAHLGCPCLGDDLYGGAAFTGKNRRFRRLGMKRILLHAYALALKHPFSRQALELLAPVPTDILATAKFVLQREKKPATTKPGTVAQPPSDDSRKQARLRLLRALRDGKALTPALLTDAGLRPLSSSSTGGAGASRGEGDEEFDEEEDEMDD